MFSNAGTLAKFDRTGIAAGFIAPKHHYHHIGLRYDPDPNAVVGIPFSEDVGAPGYEEYWSDEFQLFHNSNATIPISEDTFGGITQHFFRNGDHVSITPERAVIASRTIILAAFGEEDDVSAEDQHLWGGAQSPTYRAPTVGGLMFWKSAFRFSGPAAIY